MKNIFLFLFIIINCLLHSQELELKDKKLLQYYETISKAENNIVSNHLDSANILYKKAFSIFNKPFAKDLYNSMKVALKVNDKNNAIHQYESLRCLKYQFDEDFLDKNFSNYKMHPEKKCGNTINQQYRKTLDSLFAIDQYYRNLSNGNYEKYRKEMVKGDSIASTQLLKFIREKGFPNEYDLGLQSTNKFFFHNFYFIIWHQLKSNLWGSQNVNFSKEIEIALNAGKITPENAIFLFDLLNSTNDFSSGHFDINQFFTSNGSAEPLSSQIMNRTAKIDCCYVTYAYFPEKRQDEMKKMIGEINERRKKIGLCSIDDDLKKKLFVLDNKEYIFPEVVIKGQQFEKDSDVEFFKSHMFKIK